MLQQLFELRGNLDSKQKMFWGVIGIVFILLVWWGLAEVFSEQKPIVEYTTRLDDINLNRDSIERVDSIKIANASTFEKVYPLLPPPHKVVAVFPDLIKNDELFSNLSRSIWLNVQGYIWALLISIPFGFLIGLFPVFNGMFSKIIDALRYLPLTALTGLFIVWFGIEDQMKIAFLAFGIIVYLLPVVVQRIKEVEDVYFMTAKTLGANRWQMIKTVFLPGVFVKLMDDIRVLTAISWTYIIIAELLNRQGGIGSLIFLKGKLGQVDKVFAILIIIILVGFLQDRIFAFIDKKLMPHKYFKSVQDGFVETKLGIYCVLVLVLLKILQNIFIPSIGSMFNNLVWIGLVTCIGMIVYGELKIKKLLGNG